MPFDIRTDENQQLYDDLVDAIFEAVNAGDATMERAKFLLGGMVVAAAEGNAEFLQKWLDPDRVEEWRKECHLYKDAPHLKLS